MYNVSQNFLNNIKQNGRTFKASVTIRSTVFDDNSIIDIDLEENVNPSDTFMLGGVGSAKLEVAVVNPPGSLIIEDAPVTATISLLVNGNYEDVPLGVFTVDDIDVEKNTVKITCYDNMVKLEKAYFSDLSYPSNINSVAQEICSKAGVQLATTLPSTQINKIEGYTYREAIGFIASFLGGFCRFNRAGKLEIISYVDTGFSVTGDNYFKLNTNQNAFTIGRLSCKAGQKKDSEGNAVDNILTAGSSGNEIQFENPIMTQTQLNNIYNVLKNLSYMPYSMDWQGNQALQAGDKITITDVDNNVYITLVMDNKITYKGAITGSCSAVGKTETSQEFSSSGSLKNTVDRMVVEQANINYLLANTATIDNLTATNARIDNLYATSATIDNLTATNARIDNLSTVYATIDNLTATNAKIDNLVVGTAQIENASITSAKIVDASIVTAKIADAQITSAKILDATITSAKIALAAIDTAWIKDAAITNAKIGSAAIDTANIKTASITSALIGSGQIITAHIADAQITSTKIASATITSANIASATIDDANIKNGTITNASIKDATITTAKIALATITDANIASLNANKITAGTIDASQITVSNINASNITTGTLTANVLQANSITADKIRTGTITAASGIIADATITTALIADGQITTAKIGDAQITGAKIANATIGNAQIGSAAIGTANIQTGAITNALIGTAAVKTTQIADGSITDAKIVGLTAGKITAGTIDAANIEVINLKAANITVGTINGLQISSGAITADKIKNGEVGSDELTTTINNTINTAYSNASTALTNASNAQTTANGKNTTFYGSATPTGTFKTGDLWMKSVTGGISPMQWNGSAWVSTTDIATINAQSSIDNLQVGGVNLLSNTSSDFRSVTFGGWDSYFSQIACNPGDTFTGRIYLKPTNQDARAMMEFRSADQSVYSQFLSDTVISAGSEGYVTVTATCPANRYNVHISIRHLSGTTPSDTVQYKEAKLESGNRATDWSPAIDDVQSQIDTVSSTADGKSTVYRQVTTPTGGTYKVNDTWFDTANGNRISIWTGSGWSLTQLGNAAVANLDAGNITSGYICASRINAGTITSSMIASRTIAADRIASGVITANEIAGGTITANKIASGTITSASGVIGALDAGDITTGTLNANRIEANSITVDKIMIGDFTNLATLNEVIGANVTNAWTNTTIANGYATNSNTAWFFFMDDVQPLSGSPNEQYYVEFYAVSNTGANVTTQLYSHTWAANNGSSSNASLGGSSFTITTTEQKFTGYVSLPNFNPATTFYYNIGLGGSLAANSIKVRKVFIRKVTPAVLIQDGAITASKITAATITGDKIAANTIASNNIQANTITASDIAANTITSTQIASRTITADRIVTGAITANEIAASTITTNQIAANTITGGDIASGTITATNISAGTITTSQLASSVGSGLDISTNSSITIKADTNYVNAGENLILNGDFSQGTNPSSTTAPYKWSFWGSGVFVYVNQGTSNYSIPRMLYIGHGTTNCGISSGSIPGLLANTQYTISFKSGKEGSITSIYTQLECHLTDSTTSNIVFNYDYAKTDTVQSFTFTTPSNLSHASFVQGATSSSTSGGYLTHLGSVKLEKGNTATVWIANPDDRVGGNNVISTINISPESIGISASKIQISGTVYLSGWAHSSDTTKIDGGDIYTRSIDANSLKVNTITATSGVIATEAITDAMIANATITNASIKTGTITNALIASGTITNASIASSTITNAQIADGTITNAEIANGTIQDAKIANLNATKINAGTISADRIGAMSITTDKILIGDFTNYFPNPSMNTNMGGFGLGAVRADSHAGTPFVLTLTTRDSIANDGINQIPLRPGDQFTIEADVYRYQNDRGQLSAGFQLLKNGTTSATPTWWNVSGPVTNSVYMSWSHCVWNVTIGNGGVTGSDDVTGGWIYFQMNQLDSDTNKMITLISNLTVKKKVGNTLIQDDSITTSKIAANAVTANEIASNTITADKLKANTITAQSGTILSIDASKITTGTLDASKITVTNLSASSINTGTLSGRTITGGTISGTTISGSTITSTNSTSSLTISGASIIGKVNSVQGLVVGDHSIGFQDYENTGAVAAGMFLSYGSDLTKTSDIGLCVGTAKGYLGFGKEAADGSYITTDFVINYGNNPSGNTEKFCFFGDGNWNGHSLKNVHYINNSGNYITEFDYGIGIGTNQFKMWSTGKDGSSYSTHNVTMSCWDSFTIGSDAPFDSPPTNLVKQTFLFNCRSGNLTMAGNLVVGGSKNRAVKTDSYGVRAFNAYEMTECYFGDMKRNYITNGMCIINIDPMFLEAVTANMQYEVFVSPYGNGNVWVDPAEMYPTYFIVRGTADIPFVWEIKVKQKGYEFDRLKSIDMPSSEKQAS
ncbi:MAG: hypothetical protein ABF633_02805 [Clostridium sp.]|uniref:hypothetical protein n=1 Tax=Clostridium sp. TaxID=1506 RepID=UPI0039ED4D53